MKLTRRALFGMLLAAPFVTKAPRLIVKGYRDTSAFFAAKHIAFGRVAGWPGTITGRLSCSEPNFREVAIGGDMHITDRFGQRTVNYDLAAIERRVFDRLKSATGTVPARGHDGRHT